MDAKELPARPDLEHYKKLAKSFLRAYKTGDADSLHQIAAHYDQQLTHDQLREAVERRLKKLKGASRTASAMTLADAQFLIARSYAFESWPKLKKQVEANARRPSSADFVEALERGDVDRAPKLA